MRLARFRYNKQIYWGVITASGLRPISGSPYRRPLRPAGAPFPLVHCELLAPAEPSKIVLVGLNYRDHARELGMSVPDSPVIFLKPVTCLCAPRQPIRYPLQSKQVEYEAELALVIRKKTRGIAPSAVASHVLGYTCLNDVTARDLQRIDGQWTRAKSFDTFCPVGPWLETDFSPTAARIYTTVNGQLRQDSSTSQLIFSVSELVSFISQIMTLFPGDVVSTGTPPGVGPLYPGDRVTVSIEGIGSLINPVRSAV